MDNENHLFHTPDMDAVGLANGLIGVPHIAVEPIFLDDSRLILGQRALVFVHPLSVLWRGQLTSHDKNCSEMNETNSCSDIPSVPVENSARV